MIDWLSARWWQVLAVLAAATALALWLGAAERADDRANRQIGAAGQRAQDLQVTLERTEEADAARNEVRDPGGDARHKQCMRTARTPANCQRFLPRGAADQR